MKSIHKIIAFGLLSTMVLVGCGATFGNISLIGEAKDTKESTIGNNTRMVYMASGSLSDICNEQAKLVESAGYKASGELRDETSYLTGDYSDGTTNVTLMCSEQEDDSIKVTITMQNEG